MSINSISPLTPLKTDKQEYDYYNRFVNEYNSRWVMPFRENLERVKRMPRLFQARYVSHLKQMKNSVISWRQNAIHENITILQKESKKYNIFSKKRRNIKKQIKLFEKLKNVKESFISSPCSVIPLIISVLRVIILILFIMIFYKLFSLTSFNSPSTSPSPSFPVY